MGSKQVVDLVYNRIKRNLKKNDGVWASCVFDFLWKWKEKQRKKMGFE